MQPKTLNNRNVNADYLHFFCRVWRNPKPLSLMNRRGFSWVWRRIPEYQQQQNSCICSSSRMEVRLAPSPELNTYEWMVFSPGLPLFTESCNRNSGHVSLSVAKWREIEEKLIHTHQQIRLLHFQMGQSDSKVSIRICSMHTLADK